MNSTGLHVCSRRGQGDRQEREGCIEDEEGGDTVPQKGAELWGETAWVPVGCVLHPCLPGL